MRRVRNLRCWEVEQNDQLDVADAGELVIAVPADHASRRIKLPTLTTLISPPAPIKVSILSKILTIRVAELVYWLG
jgi:hypothetical protein